MTTARSGHASAVSYQPCPLHCESFEQNNVNSEKAPS